MAKKITHLGRPTPSEAVEGMAAAMRNCRRLAADAAVLLAAGSWPTAASLAILAVEEAGKVGVLRALSITTDRAALEDGWSKYHRGHRHKVGRPFSLSTAYGPLTDLTALKAAMDEQDVATGQVNQLKQSGFYSDCLPDTAGVPQWKEPTSSVSEEQARRWVLIAERHASEPDIKLREIELLVQHFGPVVGTPNQSLGRSTWLIAMEAEGLLPKSALEIQIEHADITLGKTWRKGSPEAEAKLSDAIQSAREQ